MVLPQGVSRRRGIGGGIAYDETRSSCRVLGTYLVNGNSFSMNKQLYTPLPPPYRRGRARRGEEPTYLLVNNCVKHAVIL